MTRHWLASQADLRAPSIFFSADYLNLKMEIMKTIDVNLFGSAKTVSTVSINPYLGIFPVCTALGSYKHFFEEASGIHKF